MKNLGPVRQTFGSGNHDYEGGDSNGYFGYFGCQDQPDGKRTVTTG
jgi:hypothetical protein